MVDKEKWKSSQEEVTIVKRLLKKKVGHCGTLDPIASGLLIMSIGKGTKISEYLMGLDKEYVATMVFGEKRDTDDETGRMIERSEKKANYPEIEKTLSRFKGVMDQYPPIYSAIKVNGERLYKKARRGEEVEIKARRVEVKRLEVEGWEGRRQELIFRVVCSKGTYIRALIRDIGELVGSYGYMKELRREKIGKFDIGDQRVKKGGEGVEAIERKLILMREALYEMGELEIKATSIGKVKTGQKLRESDFRSLKGLGGKEKYKVIDGKGDLLAILRKDLKYLKVLT